jgi:hypothetical protein
LTSSGSFVRRALALAVLALGLFSVLALNARATGDPRQTELLTIGPAGGNANIDAGWGGQSDDGTHFFFTTAESLTSNDTDGGYQDVYERFSNTTTLVSTSAANPNGPKNAYFEGTSADGSRVFFETSERLASADTDSTQDVYERSGGTTTDLSLGPAGGNAESDVFFAFNSADGTKVYFESYEQITSNDTDAGYRDVYLRNGATTSLVSIGPIGGGGNFGAQIDGITPDGAHAYIHTDEPLVASDTDGGAQDIYDRFGAFMTLISTGPAGTNAPLKDAFFEGVSTTGAHVFFTTPEVLVTSDTDASRDIYDRTGGTANLISTGPDGGNGAYTALYGGSTTDGSKVWFYTREPLVSADTDGGCTEQSVTVPCMDVYEHTSSGTTWVSTGGNGSYDALYSAGSADGARVFFLTEEALSPADTDGGYQDIYERSGGNTMLISAGGNGPHRADLGGISSDGARVFFYSYESLVPQDNDASWLDVYERYGGETTLISTGPASTNEQAVAFFVDSTLDGTKVFFFTSEKLVSGDTDSTEDVYQSTSIPQPGFGRPRGATPTRFALVPAYEPCIGSGNRQHGIPFDVPSCAPPTQASHVLTVGTTDANGFAAQSNGSFKYIVKPGDVQLVANLTDVRCQTTNAACPGGSGSAYTGKVLARATVRITDKYNGSPTNEPGTTEDMPVNVPVSCAFVSSSIGGACNVTTTMNSLVTGAVAAGRRAIWQLDDFKILDAGPNGTGFGAGCPSSCGDGDETVFMRAGVWAP